MNGLATALDTAADRCFQTIKRSVAAPSPEYWRTTSFYQKRICEKYLTVPEPEAAQPQDLAVIGHGDDLLYWIHALACTHILPHNLRLFNLRDGGVPSDATALCNLKRRRCSTSAAVVLVLSIVFRKFVSDKMKQCAGTPAMERLRSAYLP